MAARKYAFVNYTLLCLITLVMIYPVLWMLSSSLKNGPEVFSTASSLIPKNPHFENYIQGWKGFAGVSFTTFFKNSLVVVIWSTIGSVTSSTLIAYGFARIRFVGRKFWFVCMMLTMMLPPEIVMIPQYILFNKLGWLNTFLPLILPTFFGTPFFVFLIMQFIRSIPRDLEEAAVIDGCTRWTAFLRIVFPMVVPAVVTCAIFSFYWRWEEFIGPLVYLSNPKLYTVSLALKMFSDPDAVTDWGALFAMSVASLVPILIVFFIFQRYVMEGIATSGLKG
ncbi:carbohydrate ABC transporter permease [Alicyclobacillus herbarius]|uniref:carbohydrate ABC transporter permease n=1 Tax=Alicyclobacillus herbarius TaxID=122960 RepID=UPI00047CA5DA|nr:carbohydrate ABC transporter permease [Alicyclobacillus herbarius]